MIQIKVLYTCDSCGTQVEALAEITLGVRLEEYPDFRFFAPEDWQVLGVVDSKQGYHDHYCFQHVYCPKCARYQGGNK